MLPGVDLHDAQAERHRIETGFGVDQLQVPDHATGLMHRRTLEALGRGDDDPRFLLVLMCMSHGGLPLYL